MDGSRFDAWTRRRFGLAAGGLTASVLALMGLDEDAAANKRKKRCRKLDQGCKRRGKKRRCCKKKGLQCQPDSAGRNRCCRKGGEPCSIESQSECCSGTCLNQSCFCKPVGAPCGENRHCCSFNCDTADSFHCLPA